MSCVGRCFSCFRCPWGPAAQGYSRHRRDSDASDDTEPARRQALSDFFQASELACLGELENQVKVIIDSSLPSSLHGTSRVEEGIPLAIINPEVPDLRYVIMHEVMHHQLDRLGCPSLCCGVRGIVPRKSWLSRTRFEYVVRGPVLVLWELIQHSRFNPMILRVFDCRPSSARENEYNRYLAAGFLPTFGLTRGPNHDGTLWGITAAIHVAVALMEGTEEIFNRVTGFVMQSHSRGADIVQLGRAIAAEINSSDHTFLEMNKDQLNEMFYSMLAELSRVLSLLGPGMHIVLGEICQLEEKFENRSSTSVQVMFCSGPAPVPILHIPTDIKPPSLLGGLLMSSIKARNPALSG